jgi:ABC-2 type transport system permease protein
MLPQRPGHGRAGRMLHSSFGLAFRLQRGALLGWSVGMFGFGLVMGGLIGQARDATGADREWYVQLGGSEQILDAYRASVGQMAGAAAAIYVVQVLLRMRTEEVDGPLEPVLATAVGRLRWVAGYAVTAFLGVTALVLLFAVGTGVAAGAVIGDPAEQLGSLIGPSLVQLSGILVVGAAVIAVVGVVPRYAGPVCWGLLIAFVLVGPLFGPGLSMPWWVQDLSPFTHIPKVPAVPLNAAPVLGLITAVTALAVIGLVSLRRRNLALPA